MSVKIHENHFSFILSASFDIVSMNESYLNNKVWHKNIMNFTRSGDEEDKKYLKFLNCRF